MTLPRHHHHRHIRLFFILFFSFMACTRREIVAPPSFPNPPAVSYQEEGLASWYGGKFHGRKTASGERFNKNDFTCAHRTLPFGTLLKVTNLDNGNDVQVRVTDRGPAIKSRLIDVSQAAARELDMMGTGTAHVRVESALAGSSGENLGKEEIDYE